MIEVTHVKKRYGTFEALKDVSFRVQKGEVLGFLGPNGAGKTTMMRILTGFFPPSEGTVQIRGKDMESQSLELKQNIGYLPENVPLYPEMQVVEYLRFVARLKSRQKGRGEEGLSRIIQSCGLTSVQDRQIRKLSKGFKQRVGLAQALVGDPEVLVLDEPTTGLDPKQIIEIRSLIRAMAGTKTIILSTHILPEVSVICDRVMIIHEGVIIAEDTPHNLEQRLQSGLDLLLHVRGEVPQIQEDLGKLHGVVNVTRKREGEGYGEFQVTLDKQADVRHEISRFVASKYELLEMRAIRLSLEDIFVKLVTEE